MDASYQVLVLQVKATLFGQYRWYRHPLFDNAVEYHRERKREAREASDPVLRLLREDLEKAMDDLRARIRQGRITE